jgi:hypothetical protein
VAFLFASSAHAQITVYDNQATFLAAVSGAQVDTFDDVGMTLLSSPLTRTAGGYSYEVSAANGLVPGSASGDEFMSTNTATDPMTFSNFSGPVSAVGGLFFSSNLAGAFTPSSQITLLVTDSLGNLTEVVLNPTTSSFRGFTSTATISSLTVTAFNPVVGSNPLWPSVNNLTLATAASVAAVPEPGTWAMMLLGFGAIGASMRHGRRAKASQQLA